MGSGQKVFAMGMGIFLISRGMIGFLAGHTFLGLSATTDHNLLHIIFGTFLLWAGKWTRRTCARGWNKFTGWAYFVLFIFGVWNIPLFAHFLGANTIMDNLYNICVSIACLVAGFHGTKLKHIGISFMQAQSWPFGKT